MSGEAERVDAEVDSSCQVLVDPEDGYGAVRLLRIRLGSWCPAVRRLDRDRDQLVMVLDGRARVSVEGHSEVTLDPDEVVHVPRATGHTIESVDLGDRDDLLVLILSSVPPHDQERTDRTP